MISDEAIELITWDQGVPGHLVYVPHDAGSGQYGLFVSRENNNKTVFRLDDLSERTYNIHAVKPFLQLGKAVVQIDLSSSVPLNDFFKAGVYVLSPEGAGLYMPHRMSEGRGELLSLSGQVVKFEQGPRQVAFSKYKVGYMHEGKFMRVHEYDVALV